MSMIYLEMIVAVIFKRVKYRDVFRKLEEDFKNHWEELGCAGGPKELDIDPVTYLALEEAGVLACFTANKDDEIIGYGCFIQQRNLHHKTIVTATSDCFYIKPEYRKGTLGYRFLKYMQDELYRCGIDLVQMVMNINKDLDKLLTRLGYTKCDIIYVRGK